MLFTSFVRTLEPSIPTNYALMIADTACRVPTTYSLFLIPIPYSLIYGIISSISSSKGS